MFFYQWLETTEDCKRMVCFSHKGPLMCLSTPKCLENALLEVKIGRPNLKVFWTNTGQCSPSCASICFHETLKVLFFSATSMFQKFFFENYC